MGETPPYSADAYEAFAGYYALFEEWQQNNNPGRREELRAEMAELDDTVRPVAIAEAENDVFAEAYVVGHALTALNSASGNRKNGAESSIHDPGQELANREASEHDQAIVFGLLEDSVREVLPVSEDGSFDLEGISFLPQFAPRHLQRVIQQIPSMRRKLTGTDSLDLTTALVATVTHHAPDLLEGRNRKHLPGLVAEWLASDEGQASVAEVSENKMRTGANAAPNKRRTVAYTRMRPRVAETGQE